MSSPDRRGRRVSQRLARSATAWTVLAVLPAVAQERAHAERPAARAASAFVANTKVLRGLRQRDADAVFGADLAWRGDTGWALATGLAGPTWRGSYTSTEWTLAVSRSWRLEGEHGVQAGLARYEYLGDAIARDRGYTELSLAWGWRETWSASVALMPEVRGYGMRWRNTRGLGIATELGWRTRLVGATTLELSLGHVDLKRVQGRSWAWGQVLLSGDAGPLRWHAGWVGSDAVSRGAAGAQMGGGHWLTTLSWTR
jgi:hypothetical protein